MTLEEVIAEYEKRFDCTKCRYKWTCKTACTGSWALDYLKDYKALLEKPRNERLIDILREVRGEKNVE